MTCAKCQATVPEESLFCLRCGTRLTPTPSLVPRNGGGGAKAAPAERPPAPVPRPAQPPAADPAPAPAPGQTPAVPPDGKQAYALSFRTLADERLRYRVARWVCEQAPAHGLSDVQESLTRGDFATFLAFTAVEAETAKQRIEALGAHPALWRLAPATVAELMMGERSARPAKADGWSTNKKLSVVGIGLAVLFLVGMIFFQQFRAPEKYQDPPTTPPTIGGKP